ncbi:site-specific DNA-methyltransferase [Bacillus altitudinis]|uniref:site-specific DNA-methyltransferase n=1 Tax=Bacillus altitudinis TaxID=293387 RepID=UPI0020A7A3CF|nr:site-specific DNA-methyltransferase [Bacillus altitudinis]USY50650.1 site-specific DNA-methyltransferase [Bacillus altitudinis]
MVNKMNGESLDITAQNIARLKELFPEILTDGEKIDFDMLKTVLGEVVETEQERYQFTWHGKKKMIAGAQKPSKGTLRPVPEKSKNFDTTENLYIEGDNLEVLKLLQKSYNGKIKMIYIDPPYNTGKDFVYKDNFKDGVQNYLEQTGQVDAEGNRLSTNTESKGRFHTDWLNMIYARLKLARNLLTDDGVIFISIDDGENANLIKVCNEIFGENCFVSSAIWRSSDNSNNDAKQFSSDHNYTLIYSKKPLWQPKKQFDSDKQQHFKNPDNDPNGPYFDGNPLNSPNYRENLIYDVISPTGYSIKPPKNGWRWSKETLNKKIETGEIKFTNDGKKFKRRTYLKDMKGLPPSSLWINLDKTGHNRQAKYELLQIMPENVFDTPKPTKLIKYIIGLVESNEDAIILDFFGGSGTTADAIMQMNAEDGGRRKFILVQLPEDLDESSKKAANDKKVILENAIRLCDGLNVEHKLSEIARERINRAGEKVKAELKEKHQQVGWLDENTVDPDSLDIGFKVLKLDSSNIREWNVDFENLEDKLDLYETPFVEGRSEMDIVYEIMLKQGIELTYPIVTFDVNGQTIYDIAFGSLFICLSKKITPDIAKAIISRRDEHGTETSSVIFSDAGFSNDSDKLNCLEILKDAGYPEDNLLTI